MQEKYNKYIWIIKVLNYCDKMKKKLDKVNLYYC